MKKKGSALILTICVLLILTVFASILIDVSTAAYKNTVRKEKKDKLTLIAESGIEKAFAKLRLKIKITPSVFVEPKKLSVGTADNFNFTEGDVKCDVSFEEENIVTDKTLPDKTEAAIKITSAAKINASNKTIINHILKKDISNDYYDMLFNNAITVLDDVKGTNSDSFVFKNYRENGGDKTNTSFRGNIYLQGKSMTFKPDDIKPSNDSQYPYNSGINIKTNSIYAVDYLTNDAIKTSTSSKEYPILNIKDYITPELKDFFDKDGIKRYYIDQPTDKDKGYQKSQILRIIQHYDVKACEHKTINEAGKEEVSLITFIITKKVTPSNPTFKDSYGNYLIPQDTAIVTPTLNGSSELNFDWSCFTNDVKDYIMRNMIALYSNDDIQSSSIRKVPSGVGYYYYYSGPRILGDGSYDIKGKVKDGEIFGFPLYESVDVKFEEKFKQMYKLYLIDGNISISTTPYMTYFINHIIYATGKANLMKSTLKGYESARTHISLIDCSLLAKKIEINLCDYSDAVGAWTDLWAYALEWDGIHQPTDGKPVNGYSPFSISNRGKINEFLMQHLDGYENAIRFKVYKVEED